MKICKNCQSAFTGEYCSHCGLPPIHRITLSHVIHDLIHVFTHADKGIFSLTPKVLSNPGIVAGAYLEGKRKIYNPFQFLIILIGINVFLTSFTPLYDEAMGDALQQTKNLSNEVKKNLTEFFVITRQYGNVISLLSLPIFACFSNWFLKKPDYNYGEHLTIQVFSNIQIYLVNTFVLVIFILIPAACISPYYIIPIIITCYTVTFKQLFKYTWINTFIRATGIFTFGYLFQVLLTLICAIVFIVLANIFQ